MCTAGSSLKDGTAHDAAHAGWSRRQFLRGLAVAGSGVALGLNGVPVRAATGAGWLNALRAANPDCVLVLIQLAGGNDGLNTLVPLGNDLYHNARPNLAIADADTVPISADLGLHPNLAPWETLFGNGQLAAIQNVGYASPQLSHFVSTDVWMSGDNADDFSGTGWLGRYLDQAYPDFDINPPDHPVAVQIGSSSPLLFQASARSLGVSFPDPQMLARLAEGDGLFDETGVPDSLLGSELAFVRRVSNNSFAYAEALKDSYDTGRNRVGYPGTTLGRNLATVARLIRGGLSSQVFHVTLGGFDTHAYQAGGHANLLRRLADATSSFMADLAVDGQGDRVLAMTFSEFGRRIRENSSSGTDHGTAAPLFVMGPGLTGGLIGSTPDLANLDDNGNLVAEFDFRSVYSAVLGGWFGIPQDSVGTLLGGDFPAVGLFPGATRTEPGGQDQPRAFRIVSLYPNPAREVVKITVENPSSLPLTVQMIDPLGRRIVEKRVHAADGEMRVELPSGLASGNYLVRVGTGQTWSETRPVVVRR